jgi:hypothetical protein
MNEHPKPRRRWNRFVVFAVGIVALTALGVGVWGWRHVQERERLRTAAYRGLEGVWVDDSGQDISYQFREDGEFLVRQKLPSNLAPFSGDPGVEHRPWGTWSRDGQSVSVQTIRHWGFELVLGDDGLLRGEYSLDQWSGQGEHSRTKTPVVLKRRPPGP